MSTTSEHPSYSSHPRHSSLSRFTGMFRDSKSTKRSTTPTPHQAPITHARLDTISHQNASNIARRSSGTRYADMVMHMFSSSNRVIIKALNINELPVEILQNIILNLDIIDLLRIRRVCKLWRDLIPGESPLLAEKLFLKPSHSLYLYSFTVAAFDFDFEIDFRSVADWPSPTRLQPSFIEGLSMTRRCLGLIRTSSEFIFHPIIVDFNHHIQGDEAGISKLATCDETLVGAVSWRDMLVSMPPLTELRITRTKGRKCKTMCVLTAKEGVKLGAVVDALQAWGRRDALSQD